MKIGEKKILKIPVKEAYGEYDAKKVEEVPKINLSEFEKAGFKLEV
jgi:FKBP-type peptidyl-prolyl cis-trans isomerase 2